MTRIADLLAKGRTYSFEFFPPKTDAEQATLVKTLRDLEPLGPSFVSVTYRGGAESRQADLRPGHGHAPHHHPGADGPPDLRGPHPAGAGRDPRRLPDGRRREPDGAGRGSARRSRRGPGELQHASELVELAHAIGGFSVGVAAQPGGHPLSPDPATDRDHLAAKLSLADFAVSQFFFEAAEYTRLVADLADRGVDKPVLPGIMPVTSLSSVPRMATMGAAVPPWMVERLEEADRRGGSDAVRHEGVAVATELCEQLLAAGRARPALLHAQPVERHPGDLLGPGSGRTLNPGPGVRSTTALSADRNPTGLGGEPIDAGIRGGHLVDQAVGHGLVGGEEPTSSGVLHRSASTVLAGGLGQPRAQNVAHVPGVRLGQPLESRASPRSSTLGSVRWTRAWGEMVRGGRRPARRRRDRPPDRCTRPGP